MDFVSKFILFVLFFAYCSFPCFGYCKFDMKRIPGLSPIERKDQHGRICRGDILLPFCSGLCKSEEHGTYTFPYRESTTSACTLIGNGVRNISLTDCDEGANESIKFLTISDSKECGCQRLPRK